MALIVGWRRATLDVDLRNLRSRRNPAVIHGGSRLLVFPSSSSEVFLDLRNNWHCYRHVSPRLFRWRLASRALYLIQPYLFTAVYHGKPESKFNVPHGTNFLTLHFSCQLSGYVNLRTMETISSKNQGIPLWFAYVPYNAFGYLARGSPSHSHSLIQTKLALPFIQIVEHLHQIDL